MTNECGHSKIAYLDGNPIVIFVMAHEHIRGLYVTVCNTYTPHCIDANENVSHDMCRFILFDYTLGGNMLEKIDALQYLQLQYDVIYCLEKVTQSQESG